MVNLTIPVLMVVSQAINNVQEEDRIAKKGAMLPDDYITSVEAMHGPACPSSQTPF